MRDETIFFQFGLKKYRNILQLLFTDTDSLCYEIKTEDFYKNMYENKKLFDLSDMQNEFKHTTNKILFVK